MKKAFSLVLVSVLFVLAVLVLAGCSVQEKGSEAAAPLKLGFTGALTGGAASIGIPTREAVELAVEEFNAKSPKKIEVVYEDDLCEAKVGTTAIQKLTSIDKVPAIIGPLCSAVLLSSAPMLEEAKVTILSYGATNPTIKDAGDYIFRVTPSDAGQGKKGAEMAKEQVVAKVAVIYRNDDWGVGLKDVFTAEAKNLGLEVVAVEALEPGTNDARTQLTKIKEADPELVYMPVFPAETPIVLKQAKELGFTVPMLGADASKDDAAIQAAGDAAEGLVVTLPGVPDSPEKESFTAKFKAKYNKEPSAYTYEAWDAANILLNACAATDCTGTAIKEYLYKLGMYRGASGPFQFDAHGEVEKSYDIFEVKDGKFVKK